MDKEINEKSFDELHAERKAKSIAIDMLAEMIGGMMPDEYQPVFKLPQFANHINDRIGDILSLVKRYDLEEATKIASDANVLLSRIDESLEAFLDQKKGGQENEDE